MASVVEVLYRKYSKFADGSLAVSDILMTEIEPLFHVPHGSRIQHCTRLS